MAARQAKALILVRALRKRDEAKVKRVPDELAKGKKLVRRDERGRVVSEDEIREKKKSRRERELESREEKSAASGNGGGRGRP